MLFSLVAILVACQSPISDDTETVTVPGTDEGQPADAPVTEGTLPNQTTGDAWLFDDTVVHHIEITLDDADKTSLEMLPYEKVFSDVVIDGIPVSDVGVRLRGKLGSFREVYEKPKWKFDFNLVDSERRFYGLESLSLNNSVADCSFLREKLAYAVYAEAGLVVPRMAWTPSRSTTRTTVCINWWNTPMTASFSG